MNSDSFEIFGLCGQGFCETEHSGPAKCYEHRISYVEFHRAVFYWLLLNRFHVSKVAKDRGVMNGGRCVSKRSVGDIRKRFFGLSAPTEKQRNKQLTFVHGSRLLHENDVVLLEVSPFASGYFSTYLTVIESMMKVYLSTSTVERNIFT